MKNTTKEHRKGKLHVRNPGGNAGPNGRQYRLCLPPKWIRLMGITEEEREVDLSFDGDKITIRKNDKKNPAESKDEENIMQ